MQKTILLVLILIFSRSCLAQTNYKVTYAQLKELEGLYENLNNTTLEIAASPKDTILYAIIGKARYPLQSFRKDVFLNNSKQEVRFLRDKQAQVSGYSVNNDTFNLIHRNVHFPEAMWYPRLGVDAKNYIYKYKEPEKRSDGISVGNIKGTGLDVKLIAGMIQKVVDGTYPDVHSILIIKDGKLVLEEYFYQYNKDSLHQLRSATKSFISALAGIAIDRGIIKSKNEKVLSWFPEYKIENNSDAKNKITIENLLTNQSGLDCDISNEQSVGNETKMNYSDDWVKYVLDLPMADTAGGKGMYCSGHSIILGKIIEKATGKSLPGFANASLFAPMGIKDYRWRFQPDQTSSEDFCQLYLRPRDMAKFGLMYLNKGSYNGKQIISPEWVKQSLTKHSIIQGVDYGYLWWLKYLDADGVRYNGMVAQGNGGQKIYLWPEQNMVTVITGGVYNAQSPSNELIKKYILPSFNKK